jgi:hypothetical protein
MFAGSRQHSYSWFRTQCLYFIVWWLWEPSETMQRHCIYFVTHNWPWLPYLGNEVDCCSEDCRWLLKSNYNAIRPSDKEIERKSFSSGPVVLLPPFSWRLLCRINSVRPFGASEAHIHAEIRTHRKIYGTPVTTFTQHEGWKHENPSKCRDSL